MSDNVVRNRFPAFPAFVRKTLSSFNVEEMVPHDDNDAAFSFDFKTLDLHRLYTKDGEPVFFVFEGCANIMHNKPLDREFWFRSSVRPTNYIPIPLILTEEEVDPFGLFEYVRSAWMPKSYISALDAYEQDTVLLGLFPEFSKMHGEYVDDGFDGD